MPESGQVPNEIYQHALDGAFRNGEFIDINGKRCQVFFKEEGMVEATNANPRGRRLRVWLVLRLRGG